MIARACVQTFKRKNQKPLYEAILKVKEGNPSLRTP